MRHVVKGSAAFSPVRRRVKQAVIAAAMLALPSVAAAPAQARPPVPPNVFRAVRTYWHSRPDRIKAFDVISCETGGMYNTTATNGQYLGMFQMGARERRLYGHGPTAMEQARAAHRYWAVSGWSRWECA